MTANSAFGVARPGEVAAIRPAAITGYALMMPGGWRRIPVMHGTAEAIAGILDEVFSRVAPGRTPASLAPYRLEMEHRLAGMAQQARREAVIDLYLPVGYAHGVAVPASIAVSRATLGASDVLDLRDVMTHMMAGPDGARPVTVDDVQGVRLEGSSGPEPACDVPCGSRRVDYVLPVPGGAGEWLIAAFSVLDPGGPAGQFTDVLTGLFDAIMSTFRWTRD